ncbi:MAG: cellulase family glycosylhydrolase [Anaerolineae bacterium]|nr:cellulase family glycosylhydrolase [Anaerolineae bacterium]
MKALWRIIAPLALGGLLVPASASRSQKQQGVSDARFARLARGINVMKWFWDGPDSIEEIDSRYRAADFARVRDLGITWIRLPVSLDVVMDSDAPDLLAADYVAALDRALAMILAEDLAVMVDLHATSMDHPTNIFSGALEDDPTFIDQFEAFWRSFAAHLSRYDPEMVFLEPLNEPVFEGDADPWFAMQRCLLGAIRESAPAHTLVATGTYWSHIYQFVNLDPLDDPNIIYNFHFYEPFVFTHQGAAWTPLEVMTRLHDVPYPSSPERVAPLIEQQDDTTAQYMLEAYGKQAWDAEAIARTLGQAAQWAKQHNARVICNEFGAYRLYTPPEDRVQWIHDTRTALEQYGFGWAMWELDGTFGLMSARSNTGMIVDTAVAAALGLDS